MTIFVQSCDEDPSRCEILTQNLAMMTGYTSGTAGKASLFLTLILPAEFAISRTSKLFAFLASELAEFLAMRAVLTFSTIGSNLRVLPLPFARVSSVRAELRGVPLRDCEGTEGTRSI